MGVWPSLQGFVAGQDTVSPDVVAFQKRLIDAAVAQLKNAGQSLLPFTTAAPQRDGLLLTGPVSLTCESAQLVVPPTPFNADFSLSMYLHANPAAGTAAARFDTGVRCGPLLCCQWRPLHCPV